MLNPKVNYINRVILSPTPWRQLDSYSYLLPTFLKSKHV
nr:MAG TPA_asm: hypothetical protein [Caudoviricetes sp.]DAV04336.1 MAG TPA: hypothetical protein [Caudoviricetes sp.]